MFRVFVVGIANGAFSSTQRKALDRCHFIVAAEKYHEMIRPLKKKIIDIIPIGTALELVDTGIKNGNVGLIASGDPLFFGIAKSLLDRYGKDMVEILPALSSLQLACARFKIPWDDALIVSLHGRKKENFVSRLLVHEKVIVLTDNHYTPPYLAKSLFDYLELIRAERILIGIRMYIAENLGSKSERLIQGNLEAVMSKDFSAPNIVIITRPSLADPTKGPLGLNKEEIIHSRGLITKDEVRAVTLHKLNLPRTGVFWDIGAGSGSISIEAGRICPQLNIFPLEKEDEQLENIRRNIVAFETFNITPITGTAPDALNDLPSPDRVFVGGSGGKFAQIVSTAAKRLNHGGRIIINGVTDKTKKAGPKLLSELGFHVDVSEVNICRYAVEEKKKRKFINNPITVITGKK